MKNTKVKNKIINISGKIKNIVLISVVMFSLLVLFSGFIYNNIITTFIIKLIALINIYSFCSVNAERLIKG